VSLFNVLAQKFMKDSTLQFENFRVNLHYSEFVTGYAIKRSAQDEFQKFSWLHKNEENGMSFIF
jgi:hypothetical protein